MAYKELVKNFKRVRDYLREFYVYGFKSREEFTRKSARSYDDERRRLESWLGDYMQFRQTSEGKRVFLSMDSRLTKGNPLFKAWKTKSFTDGDITLHFVILDILSDSAIRKSMGEIMVGIDQYFSQFSKVRTFDESTVRKKLKEYVAQGILISEKRGKILYYRRVKSIPLPGKDVLDYFSEVLPCGVIGSYLLDKKRQEDSHFVYKHHYITGIMDSEILYSIFLAIRERRSIILETLQRDKKKITKNQAIPLKVMISAQSGRQYLMTYVPLFKRFTPFRTDHILSVSQADISDQFHEFQERLEAMLPYIWGISTRGSEGRSLEHVEFTVHYEQDETYIRKRLEREKRCGRIEHIDDNTSKFSADVFDASEMIPWIRTFICRIKDIQFSNKSLEAQFKKDMKDMYALYDIGGDESDDFQ